ncbi:MAG: potassium channel protein [Bacteroidetes bacterium]|nr:potassium channel protein [Bacteroidota bacterium]
MAAKNETPFKGLYVSLGLMFLVTTIGVMGFMGIEGYGLLDAVFMTVITLSTVGYQEVHPLSDAGKVFDTILIVTNLGLFTYFISTLTRYFIDGEFRAHLKNMKMERSIAALEGHTILCGYGRNGRAAAKILSKNNASYVVIERAVADKQRATHHIEGDATDEETLIAAGIARAGALITTLPVDAENLYIVLSARQLNSRIKIISRASDDQAVKKMKIAGADNVIMPDKIGGAHMATLVLNPDLKEFMDVLSAQGYDGTTVEELPIIRQVQLQNLDPWRATGANILAIKKGQNQYIMNPAHDVQVSTGDRLIVMGNKEQIAALRELV